MKVLVNVTPLIPPLTGIGHYTQNLLKALLAHPEVEDVKGILPGRILSAEQLSRWVESPDAQEPDDGAGEDDPNSRSAKPVKPALSLRLFSLAKRILKRIPPIAMLARWLLSQQKHLLPDGYVYWEPNFILQEYKGGASVSTIHDLSFLHHPETHRVELVQHLEQQLPVTLEQAERIICVSDFTRGQLQAAYQPKQAIDIVHAGVEPCFFTVTDQQIQSFKQRNDLPEHYLLSVATLEPRKNFLRLFNAFEQLPQAIRQQYPLVLAGSRGWHSDDIQANIQRLEADGELKYLGYVDQVDMPALFAGATAMAYVSIYEGFGMPIAEAMAANTPVITSALASMPEVANNSACLVDPMSEASIKQGLLQVLSDSDLRQELAIKGRARAEQLRWQHSAEALVTCLKAADRKR